MKAGRRDRGAIGVAVVAPVLAAIIGGGAAILGAVQIVHLAPSSSDNSSSVSNSDSGAVDYGNNQK